MVAALVFLLHWVRTAGWCAIITMMTEHALSEIAPARIAHLATVDAQQRPHNVPVCFAVVDGALYIAIDEKPKRGDPRTLRRVRNIERNPAVCLVVDHYAEDWSQLWWVQVRGHCTLVEDDETRQQALAALRAKYPQYQAMALEERPLLQIVPEQFVQWHSSDSRIR